jgi:transcriptional regulator with XRE-family HTH domain
VFKIEENVLLLIARRLLEARNRTGMTMNEVKQKTGISTGNISCWEHGKYLPGATALIALSNLYNVTIDWILKGDADSNKEIPTDTLPEAETDKKYSGSIPLRVPKSLHRTLFEEANAEAISINQLVLAKISVSLSEIIKRVKGEKNKL